LANKKKYLGKRVKRGLFRSSSGYLYGADINGSLNIGRKVVGEVAFSKNPIERLIVSPVRVKAYKADSKCNVAYRISNYEENQEPIPDIYGLELLKFILEERNLQKQDLLSIFESKSTLDDILDGQQELTPIYIQKLANFLNISPDLFFPS
jgi:antitoxin component HigA of HigAB toxin-antitoxin module